VERTRRHASNNSGRRASLVWTQCAFRSGRLAAWWCCGLVLLLLLLLLLLRRCWAGSWWPSSARQSRTHSHGLRSTVDWDGTISTRTSRTIKICLVSRRSTTLRDATPVATWTPVALDSLVGWHLGLGVVGVPYLTGIQVVGKTEFGSIARGRAWLTTSNNNVFAKCSHAMSGAR
jgi:hypothetical protein